MIKWRQQRLLLPDTTEAICEIGGCTAAASQTSLLEARRAADDAKVASFSVGSSYYVRLINQFFMAKNEKTSKGIASLAGRVLNGSITRRTITPSQLKKLAGTALTQAPDKKRH